LRPQNLLCPRLERWRDCGRDPLQPPLGGQSEPRSDAGFMGAEDAVWEELEHLLALLLQVVLQATRPA
jgi:hypothetical protein